MLRNYVKLALRGLRRHKLYGIINIVGLAIGLAGCLLTVLFIRHELSFDTYHENVHLIYRLVDYSGFGEKQWDSYVTGDPISSPARPRCSSRWRQPDPVPPAPP